MLLQQGDNGINAFTNWDATQYTNSLPANKLEFWMSVASDRFPRCGAVAISIMGGIGMMSAGLVGSPGLGYAKDRFAGEELQKSPAAFEQYKAGTPSKWLASLRDSHSLPATALMVPLLCRGPGPPARRAGRGPATGSIYGQTNSGQRMWKRTEIDGSSGGT